MQKLSSELDRLDTRFKAKCLDIEIKLDDEIDKKIREHNLVQEWMNKHETLYDNVFKDLNSKGKRITIAEDKFVVY